MKHLVILLLPLLFLNCEDSTTKTPKVEEIVFCDCNELILDTDYQRYYLSDKKKPFTGQCITYTAQGIKVFERNYFKGKYHGLVIVYHPNGNVKSTTEYEHNLMTGDQKIFGVNGGLLSHAIYLRSQLKEIIK